MIKRILSLILSIVVSLSLASCSLTSYERRYPSYFTGEYVKEHYELVDMNLVYLESYRRRTSSVSDGPQSLRFMKIKDVPLEQFVGMTSSLFLSSGCNTYVLFNSNLLGFYLQNVVFKYCSTQNFQQIPSRTLKLKKSNYMLRKSIADLYIQILRIMGKLFIPNKSMRLTIQK